MFIWTSSPEFQKMGISFSVIFQDRISHYDAAVHVSCEQSHQADKYNGLCREYINAAMARFYTRLTISSLVQLIPQDASSVLIVVVRKRCFVSYLLLPSNNIRLSNRNLLAVGRIAESTGQTYATSRGRSATKRMQHYLRQSQLD